MKEPPCRKASPYKAGSFILKKMHLIIDTAVLDSKKTDRTLDTTQNQVSKQTFNHLSKSQESTSSPDIKPAVSTNSRDSATDDAQRKINSLFYDEEKHTYEGRVKIDIAPPIDIEQIGILGEYLAKTPNLKVLQKGEAEDGSAWIEIDLLTSTPLLDLLRKIPDVKDVVGCKSYIIVALKSHQVV